MEVKFIYSCKTQFSSHNLRQYFRSVGEKTKEGFSLSIQYWPLWGNLISEQIPVLKGLCIDELITALRCYILCTEVLPWGKSPNLQRFDLSA